MPLTIPCYLKDETNSFLRSGNKYLTFYSFLKTFFQRADPTNPRPPIRTIFPIRFFFPISYVKEKEKLSRIPIPFFLRNISVSYTHLDVYKRQGNFSVAVVQTAFTFNFLQIKSVVHSAINRYVISFPPVMVIKPCLLYTSQENAPANASPIETAGFK